MASANDQRVGVCAGCQGPGHLQCKSCLLVLYCSARCQRSHWSTHKTDCKSPLSKDSWRPQWEVQGRKPSFIGEGPQQVPFGNTKKYLWGNVPAIDVLRLEANEGTNYDRELKLLFAASGDLRNVVRTITALPADFSKPLSLTLNDRETTVVARNVILLLVCLTSSDQAKALDCMIHLWYSSLIQQSHLDVLRLQVRPLLQDVCSKIANKKEDATLGKTWHFGERSLRLVLTKEQWFCVLAHCDVPNGLSISEARELRSAITLAPSRQDYRDRRMFATVPHLRLSSHKFREHGILVPFGQSLAQFNVPNPTFFHASEWPMKDAAEPLDSWSLQDVLKTQRGAAANDIYGHLYHYVKDELAAFCTQLDTLQCKLELYNTSAEKLSDHLSDGTFARVEVANISDAGYLGMGMTAYHLGRFLQSRNDNPHATLITLFLNIEETISDDDQRQSMAREQTLVSAYLPLKARPASHYDAELMKRLAACNLVRDYDMFFERYMQGFNFKDVDELLGLAMKKKHTIIEKWPMRLKLRPGQPGAKEEFNLLLGSGQTGCERYVEWARK